MRTQHRAVAAIAAFVLVNAVAVAQNAPIQLSLAHADWVSDDAYSLISAVRVLSNGTVLVADGKETEVHLLDATGKTIRQVGRKGSGPGEFTNPAFMIALPADSTLLLDLGARRYVIIDPRGQVVKTESISQVLGAASDGIAGADPQGRLLFGLKFVTTLNDVAPRTPIGRWTRGTNHFDTVTMFQAEVPPIHQADAKGSGFKTLVAQAREVFAAVDDWVAAPSGRVAIIHAVPYRVDWVEPNGKTTTGKPVKITRIPVTEADRKQREPDGPPYRRLYAQLKSPFMTDWAIVDPEDNVWVPRSEPAVFKSRRWDVFSATGQLRSTVLIPNGRALVAITATHAYVRHTDADGLQWIERYKR